MEVDRLVAKNEEALSRIRTFRGIIETRQSTDKGKTWKPIEVVSVVRDGRRERIQDRLFGIYTEASGKTMKAS